MGYNVIDLIDKAINIAVRRTVIFEEIGQRKNDNLSIEIMSKVLIKQVNKTIQYYQILKDEIVDTEVEEIDFIIYDKISFLINEFNKKVYAPNISNVEEYLKFSLGLLKDTYSLLVDIQGRFIKNTSDIHTKTYEILSNIISSSADHIASLEKTLKYLY